MTTFAEHAVSFGPDGRRLFGIVHLPEQVASVGVVIVVGGPQYRVGSHRMFVDIARALAVHGVPVLRFDFQGMGDSEGEFPGFEDLDADISCASQFFLSSNPGIQKLVLLGLCDGASAAAFYAPKDSSVAGLVLLNPWVHTEAGEAKAYLWHYYPRRLLQADFWRGLLAGKVRVMESVFDFFYKLMRAVSRSRPLSTNEGFVDRMRRSLSAFAGPLLVVASENDLTATEFLELCKANKSWLGILDRAELHTLAGADHTLSSAQHMQEFCEVTRRWLNRCYGGAVISDDERIAVQ